MKANQKAKELVKRFEDENYFDEQTILDNAKTQALICVDEILTELKEFSSDVSDDAGYAESRIDFFNEVIQEIKNL